MKEAVDNSDIKKWGKRVETAGRSARALGWLFLGIIPLYVIIGSYVDMDIAYAAYAWLFLGPVAIFYIYNGKYIAGMGGNKIGKFLLFNGITTLLMFRGLIPLIVAIESFIGYSSFKKLSKTNITVNVGDAKLEKSELVLIAVFAVVGSIAVIVGALHYQKSYVPQSPELSAQKANVEALTEQVNTCVADLTSRETSLDTTSQEAVDSFNADRNSCEETRLKQNSAVETYNAALELQRSN